MTCAEFRCLCPAALSGTLAEPLREPFADHLVDCEECRHQLDGDGVVDALVALAKPRARPGSFDRQLVSLTLGVPGEPVARRSPAWVAVLAVALLAAVLGWVARDRGVLAPKEDRPDEPVTAEPAAPRSPPDAGERPPGDAGPFDDAAPARLARIVAKSCPFEVRVVHPPRFSRAAPGEPWTAHVDLEVLDASASPYAMSRAFPWSSLFDEFDALDVVSMVFLRRGTYSARVSVSREQAQALPQSWDGSDGAYCRRFMTVSPAKRITLGAGPHSAERLLEWMKHAGADVPGALRAYFQQYPIAVGEDLVFRDEPRPIRSARVTYSGELVFVAGGEEGGAPTQEWSDPSGEVTIRVWTE